MMKLELLAYVFQGWIGLIGERWLGLHWRSVFDIAQEWHDQSWLLIRVDDSLKWIYQVGPRPRCSMAEGGCVSFGDDFRDED